MAQYDMRLDEANAKINTLLADRQSLRAKLAAANESVTLLERQRNDARKASSAYHHSAKMWRTGLLVAHLIKMSEKGLQAAIYKRTRRDYG